MELLESIVIEHKSGNKYIKLYHGDLTAIPKNEAVDLLVISAFPNNYIPTSTSLIGALHDKGLSVAQLAQEKEADLRSAFSCWLSKDLNNTDPGLQFKKILCFEPLVRGQAAEVVGDIFRSLMPFLYNDPPLKSIAMPVVASGDQRVPIETIFEPLFDAAFQWLSHGIPVETIKIVAHSRRKAEKIKTIFSSLKQKYSTSSLNEDNVEFEYDFFVSYSHENSSEVDSLVAELQSQNSNVRVFLDRLDLKIGSAWQEELYQALEKCKKIITVYSPSYLNSKMCKEEFNIARFRHRESEEGVLLPIYLYSADLPIYMKMVQYVDCREGNKKSIDDACKSFMALL